MSHTMASRPSSLQRLVHLIIGDFGVGTTTRLVLAIIIMAGIVLAKNLGWSLHLAWTTAVIASYAAIVLMSPSVRNFFHQQDFVGYWKYENKPDYFDDDETHDQAPQIIRVVSIDRDQNNLRLRGWLTDAPHKLFFTARKVVMTNFGKKSGELFYWYTSPSDAPPDKQFFGLVVIQWDKEHPAGPITEMMGRYYGNASRSMGAVSYHRISEKEFYDMRSQMSDAAEQIVGREPR